MRERPWIIIPCFNEAERLDRGAFEEAMAQSHGPVFIFVDDGSTDRTPLILKGIQAAGGPRCQVVTLPENRGKAEAVRQGLQVAITAGAPRLGYWDADLATPLPVIDDLARELEARPEVEVVMGSRVRMLGRRIERSGLRHLIGRAYATLASLALRIPVYDTQCGAKLFRSTPALTHALAAPFRAGWGFDVELLQRLQRQWGERGVGRIVEVPLREWHDVGASKVSLAAGARAFIQLARMALRPAPVRIEEGGGVPEAGDAGEQQIPAGGGS